MYILYALYIYIYIYCIVYSIYCIVYTLCTLYTLITVHEANRRVGGGIQTKYHKMETEKWSNEA